MLLNRRYEIKSKIGQGAIGEVFKAYDTLDEKNVALKIAKPERICEGKIINEFKIITQIEHPHIISALDFGVVRVCDDESLISRKFIAFEYCDKFDLVDVASRYSLKEKIEIIYQISHALHIIHKIGYIHRDLKPENIVLDRTIGAVKITDLGLAVEYEQISHTETPAGTLLYIAPEVLQGKKYDHRVDIYSLGILIYQILTGSSPFESENPMEIIRWHLSKKNLNFTNFVPEEFKSLLNSMLNPDPSRRPQNVLEVINILKKLNPELKQIKNFKVRKPFGKDEALKTSIDVLESIKLGKATHKVSLIVGADGLGKTSLMRCINIEAKLFGFETLKINELNIQEIVNLLSKSPFTIELTPEIRLKLEKFKEVRSLNSYIMIEFAQFIREIILNSSPKFPVVVLIDDITPDKPYAEIFLKSFLSPESFALKNTAFFISCTDVNFFDPLIPNADKIYLRPLNFDELKKYIQVNFDFDAETVQKFAEILAEYTSGISAVIEIFSHYISNEIESNPDAISQITKVKFDEIIKRLGQLSKEQREILDILSLEDEPIEIGILKKFSNFNISAHLNQLYNSGFIKIERDKVSIAYKALKEHIENIIGEQSRKKIHLNYAVIYLNQSDWENRADKILWHFARAENKEGIEKLANKGIEKLISKGEFKKAISLCKDIFNFLPEYLKPSFKIKLADLNLKLGNYADVIPVIDDINEPRALELKSEAYFHIGDTNKAMEILRYAFKTADTIYDKVKFATRISQIYASIGDVESAFWILSSFENTTIEKFIAKTELIGDLYAGLGIISQIMGKIEKARKHFELSLKYRIESKNNLKIIAGYNNMANFFSITGQYDEAIKYWSKALKISESIGDIIQSAHIYNNIGISHFKRGSYDNALENYRKALAIYKAINDVHGIANVLGNIGELLIDEFRLEEAYENIKEAEGLYEESNNIDGVCAMNLLLLSLYLNAGDIKNAESTLNEINSRYCNIPNHLLSYNRVIIEMKKGNITESANMLTNLLELDEVKKDREVYLKILISLLKLNSVIPEDESFKKVNSILSAIVDEIYNSRLRAFIFFLLSLCYEGRDKITSLTYLNKALDELGGEFAEFKWKAHLRTAQYYKSRGIEIKFIQHFENALLNFQDLIERIKNPEMVKSYLNDLENQKFFKLLQNLKV